MTESSEDMTPHEGTAEAKEGRRLFRRSEEDKRNAERERRRAQQRKARQRRAQADRKRREAEEEQRQLEKQDEEQLRRTATKGWRLIIMALGFIFLCICGVFATLGHRMTFSDRDTILAATAAGAVGLFLIILGLALPPLQQARAEIRRREKNARQRARHAMDDVSEVTDLDALFVANRTQMDAYDDLARLQARESFRNSQIAIGIGLLAFITGGVISLAAQDTTAQVTTATLAALAGGLSGYIGKTFLRVYDRAQQQLTFFFQQPLITSYLLSAERLVQDMDDQDQERSRIVGHIMDVLVTVPETWQDWSNHGGSRRGIRGKSNGNGATTETERVTHEAAN